MLRVWLETPQSFGILNRSSPFFTTLRGRARKHAALKLVPVSDASGERLVARNRAGPCSFPGTGLWGPQRPPRPRLVSLLSKLLAFPRPTDDNARHIAKVPWQWAWQVWLSGQSEIVK